MQVGVHSFKSVVTVNSISRNTQTINQELSLEKMRTGCRLGADSHANTCCVNEHAYVESVVEGVSVDAIPFNDSLGKLSNLSIVHAILTIDNMLDGQTHLIRICNAIYVPNMQHCLLCQNQAREYGTIIDDVPKSLDHTGTSTFSMHTEDGTIFSFQRHRPTAFLHVQRPTAQELDSLTVIDITEEEEWIPYDGESEISAVNFRIDAISISCTSNIYEYYEPVSEHLFERVQRSIASTMTTKPKGSLTPEYLSSIWNCGKETARKTIEATTCKHYRRKERGITQRFKPSRNFMLYRQIALPAGRILYRYIHLKGQIRPRVQLLSSLWEQVWLPQVLPDGLPLQWPHR